MKKILFLALCLVLTTASISQLVFSPRHVKTINTKAIIGKLQKSEVTTVVIRLSGQTFSLTDSRTKSKVEKRFTRIEPVKGLKETEQAYRLATGERISWFPSRRELRILNESTGILKIYTE